MTAASVAQETLEMTLRRACAIAPRKPTNPMQSTVMLSVQDHTGEKAYGGYLEVMAFNDFVVFSDKLSIEAGHRSQGGACVNAHGLYSRTKALPQGSARLSWEEGTILLKGDTDRSFRVASLTADDWPSFKVPTGEAEWVKMTSTILSDVLGRASYAQGTDPSRGSSFGVRLALKDGNISASASDGHRLVSLKVGDPDAEGELSPLLLPPQGLEAIRSLSEKKTMIEMSREDNVLFVRDEFGAELIIYLTGVLATDFVSLTPKFGERMSVDYRFTEAVKALSVATDQFGYIKLMFGKNELKLMALGDEAEAGVDRIEVEYEGEPFEVKLSCRYLTDAVAKTFQGEDIQLALVRDVDPRDGRRKSPVAFVSEDNKVLALVMPSV